MTNTADTKDITPAEGAIKTNKKKLLLMILIILMVLAGGVGGTWYVMQNQMAAEGDSEEPKKKPTTFIELDTFTVNLQPEEGNQYLQVGLTIKVQETDMVGAFKNKMPEIRSRILLLLSSKKASEISTVAGKKQLSKEITDEIKQIFYSENSAEKQEEIIDALFTSFVIQ